MTATGTNIVTYALREIGVKGEDEVPEGWELEDGLFKADLLLDTWRTVRRMIPAVTISTYSLVQAQQDYTIGPSGDFSQVYPTVIERWSVVPDDDATDPLEIPQGRPLDFSEWQQISVKSTTAKYPTKMYYDQSYNSSGQGTCSFYPIPDNNDVDVKLYNVIPDLTSIAAGTTYDLRPGLMRALVLKLAITCAPTYGSAATVSDDLRMEAKQAEAAFLRSNYRPIEAPLHAGFAIGSGNVRHHNIYTDD